jgi:type IV fimbrial biogenesis protein FimU
MGGALTPIIRPRRESLRGQARGVTLPELLIVVAIIGLFALLAIPAIGNYIRAARVRASNDALVADIRLVRYIAITNRTTTTITIDQSAGSYSYTDIHGRTVTRKLEQWVSFTSVTNSPISFRSDGSLSTNPATVVIQAMVTPTITYQFTIAVNSTGRVTSALLKV